MSDNPHSNVVALTGIYGSGKSTVASMLADFGAYVVKADDLAREAVMPGTPALKKIKEHFTDSVISPQGSLLRSKLAALIFNSAEKRSILEAITHPEIQRLAEDEFLAAQAGGAEVIVYDCPLLFESGLDELGFKKIILVVLDRDTCIERVLKRDSISREDALKRFSAQLPLERKMGKADIIIDNSSTLDSLRQTVQELYSSL